MKKLFFALALTGFVGAASINTVCAMTHSKICVSGGEEDKKKKEKNKKSSCCKSKTTASVEVKGTSEGETKKCCAKKTSQTSSCHDNTTSGNTETKTDVKKVEEAK